MGEESKLSQSRQYPQYFDAVCHVSRKGQSYEELTSMQRNQCFVLRASLDMVGPRSYGFLVRHHCIVLEFGSRPKSWLE